MLSGTDLIRTSVQNTERAKRLLEPVVNAVEPTENPGHSGLDEETQNALVRFARFVHKEKKAPVKKARKPGLPQAYQDQVDALDQSGRAGAMIDVYV